MSKKCPLCGGVAVLSGKNFLDEDVYECTFCHEPGHHSRFKEQTVFDHITESVEALAEKLVYYYLQIPHFTVDLVEVHRSTIIPHLTFESKEEAISATVEELKKEYKG